MQIKAGLKKEWLFFTRSFRFAGIIIIFLGCALFFPLLCGSMTIMNDMFDTVIEAEGGTVNIEGMEIFGDFDPTNIFSMFEGENGLFLSYTSSIEMFASASLGSIPLAAMVVLILLSQTAGGEQKKRSIILPQTAGLTPKGYVLPKFILYPPIIFILSIISMLLTNGVCHLVFKTSYSFETVFMSGVLIGLSLVFMICLYFFLGIALEQPGLSVIYVLLGNAIFSTIINFAFEIDKFTPWNLINMAYTVVNNDHNNLPLYSDVSFSNIVITMIITFVLCIVFMLLTLLVMNTKRMDNTADEVY